MTRLLAATFVVSAALFTCFAGGQAALANPRCNSFNYGIGDCVNEGQFRSYPSRNNDGGSGINPLLLDQPRSRSHSGLGYGYSNNELRQGW